jgi:CO/xanthine dehydrogenase FAD-binding subunit
VDGRRELPIAEFYRPDGIAHMDMRPGELLTHITIPRCDDRSVFLKFTPRRGMDFALGAVAARCNGSGEQATRVSIIVGSMSAAPLALDEPCRVLACIRDEMGEITTLYARATYKKQIARTLVKRALMALREQR